VGGILGIIAVIASRNATPAPGGSRINAALIGRVFGILGIALSIGAVAAFIYARNAQLGP
jgi:flagellar motor component MotA